MVLKRPFSDEEDGVESEVPSQGSKRRITFATVVRDVMKQLSANEFLTMLEPFLRSVVREEVERAVLPLYHSFPRSSLNQSESSQARAWRLHFVNKLPSTLFTSSRVESEDSYSVQIVIMDPISGNIITSGPLSSVKIEIVALDGDFGADDQEDWTENEFNANIVRQREGKRPLVTGDLFLTLRDGVGFIGDVSFTDNSSWIRSRRFRLGARIVQSSSTEVRIREAKSEAFVVKDHRGESYKKHHPPHLNDEIWRIEKIAKDGKSHKKLAGEGISTVEDFLRLYYGDPSALRKVLGSGISNKIWETIIEHATACVPDDKFFVYYKDAERVGLLFNSVFNVVGATFDGQSYLSLDKLNAFQTGFIENLKRCAYTNLNDLVPFDGPSAVGPPAMLPSVSDPYSSSSSHLQDVNFPGLHQDQLEMQLASSNHMAMTTSPPYSYDVQDYCQPEISVTQLCHNVMATDSCCGPYGGGNNSWAPSGPFAQINNLIADDNNSQVGISTWQQGNGLFFPPRNNDGVGVVSSNLGIRISRNGKPKARWCMLRAAVKWGISVRRVVAAKKMARLFYRDF